MRDQFLCKTCAKQQASKQRSKLQSFAFAGKPQAGIKPQGLSPCFSFQNENMLFSRPLFGVRKLTQNPLTPRCNKQFQSGLHFWVHFCSKRWRHVVVVFTKKKKPHFWWENWPQNGGHILDPILGPRVMKMKGGPQNGAAQWTPKWGHG